MLDMLRTLQPESGVARAVSVRPPAGAANPLWTAAVDIGAFDVSVHRGLAADDFDAGIHLVGACGMSRADVVTRGCGEAVERFALIRTNAPDGPPQRRARLGELAGRALEFTGPGVALGDPAAETQTLTWYGGRDLDSGGQVWVPAPLVDYPPSDEQAAAYFDPSPSGAASGAGLDHALRGALLELIERDAVMAAWGAQLELSAIRLPDVLEGAPAAPPWRELRSLAAAVRGLGLDPVLARIPTCVDGLDCVVCAIVDQDADGMFAAVGCRAAPHAGYAVLVALQEAVQVRATLIGARRHYGPIDRVTTVANDRDRARYWTTAQAVTALHAWTSRFTAEPWRHREVPVGVESLAAAMAADGAAPVAVDLTGRLPQSLVSMGWAAAKVIAPGYQALRMDERHAFTWNTRRVATASARTGRAAGVPAGRICEVPQPLI